MRTWIGDFRRVRSLLSFHVYCESHSGNLPARRAVRRLQRNMLFECYREMGKHCSRCFYLPSGTIKSLGTVHCAKRFARIFEQCCGRKFWQLADIGGNCHCDLFSFGAFVIMRTIKRYLWAFLILGAVLAYKFFSGYKVIFPPGGTPTIAASCSALRCYQKNNRSFIPGMCS